MDLSPEPSQDEARTMDRPLYPAGQTPKTPKPSPAMPARSIAKPLMIRSALAKRDSIPMLQRRLVRIILAALLLLLGGALYYVFLFDRVEQARREMSATWQNKDLTPEQRNEKRNQIVSSLSDQQRLELRMPPELRVRIHDDYDAFFKLSPAEQAAQLRKEILEEEKRVAERRAELAKERAELKAKMGANGGGRGPAGGGGPKVVGPGRGGPGGARPVPRSRQREDDPTQVDMLPPETWQQSDLKKEMKFQMRKQMGLRK